MVPSKYLKREQGITDMEDCVEVMIKKESQN